MTDTERTRAPARRLTHRQAIDLNRFMEKICRKTPHGAVYDEGWDDKRVALELNLSHSSVADQRRQNFGDYANRPPRGRAAYTEMQNQIDELRERVTRLEAPNLFPARNGAGGR